MPNPPDKKEIAYAKHALFSVAMFFVGLAVVMWFVRHGHSSAPLFAPTAGVGASDAPVPPPEERSAATTDAEWKVILSAAEFDIIRQQGTERPFSSPLDYETRPGTYVSADCGVPLFRSEQKYDSGTGWPSFWAPISPDVLTLVEDKSIPFETRVEVRDAKCDGHLGHVFDDGPPPTGKRYCMNGVALRFIPDNPGPVK